LRKLKLKKHEAMKYGKTTIEKSQKEAVEEIKVLRTDYNALHTRVAVIETENRINSKQEGTIITMLNRIFNSIEKK